jgi:hypothetical protein
MKNTFQYSHLAFGVIYTDCRGSGRGLSRGVCLMSYSAVPHYLKLNRSMGVDPCEWSEVNTNAATKEGFFMNTLRRISRPLVKTFAVGAVMVAAALPAMALAGTASAATTAPTILCTAAGSQACTGYAVIGQGFGGNFVADGTSFANDQAVGGVVTLTTTAPGVTFSDVTETSATALTATIDSSSTTTPGFYPVTLTDDNGTTTFTVGLGVDNGPQITTIAGNTGAAGASAAPSTVTVTGTFLNDSVVTLTGVTTPPAVSATVLSNSGTTLSFTVANNAALPGTYGISVTSGWPTGALGVATSSYTLSGAPVVVSITAVTPNELGIPAVNPSSQTVTISGTGFELGAVLTISGFADATVTDPTFVNSTTMTALVTVGPEATPVPGELNVSVVNPDTSSVAGTDLIGVGEPATNTVAGPAAPVAPAITSETGSLTPGTASIIHAQGSSTFPITTGSTVSVSQTGVTNTSETLTGTVVSVDSTNTATVSVQVPRFATTTSTAAVLAGATSIPVANTTGFVAPFVATIIDGTSSENVNVTAVSATAFTTSATVYAHLSGVTVEVPFPAATNTLSINNGTDTETTPVVINAAPAAAYTAASTGATLGTLDPGTYSINAYVPGFGFKTGSAVTFQSFNGTTPDNDGVTGTVAVVNGNTATLTVTVPKVRSSATGDYLTTTATPGQSALQLNSVVNSALTPAGNIAVGDSITINADSFYTTPETVTVTSVNAVTNVVGITPALADNHTGGAAGVGATISDNSDPQSLTDTVEANITNGNGGVDLVGPVTAPFFTFTTAGTMTASLNPVGAGASAATEVFTLSGTGTTDNVAADWAASSTTAGVTFGAVTGTPGATITVPINVAAGTAANATVPVTLTDGLETYTGSIAIVAGPTITAVTAVGDLTAGSVGFTIGVTGTNFVVGDMSCTTSDPAVTCVVDTEITDSTTTATVTLTPGAAMLNGTDSLTLIYSGGATPTFGAGTLAGAFTVTGQPTITTIAPSVIPAGTTPALTLTGTLFPGAYTSCSETITTAALVATTVGCTAPTDVSATSATITGYTAGVGGDTIVFTVGTATSTAVTPAVTVQADPVNSFLISSSIWTNFTSLTTISVGSTAVPFHIVGTGYLAGATVTLSIGTATVTEVTPNAIFGTITIPSTATAGTDTVTVTNANGGSDVSPDYFNVAAAPSITTPSVATPMPILDGVPTTVTITGTGFAAGAVVTGAVAGVDTFGTATVSNSANAADLCTGLISIAYPAGDFCNTISVMVTPVSYSGSTPILDGLVVTNPVGGGAVTVQNDLTINPVPTVTGVYYVPTFTTNAEITINGTGFETGITASSANPDYTVLAVASTPTTVTLLVSTDSNATSGTSSTITLTNPDGGSGTFPLNGGPNPNTATPTPKATRVNGVVHTGRVTTITISGKHFYGQPTITSNDKGTKAKVSKDYGNLLRVRVTTLKTTKHGVHTFILRFANGEQTSVKYNDVK